MNIKNKTPTHGSGIIINNKKFGKSFWLIQINKLYFNKILISHNQNDLLKLAVFLDNSKNKYKLSIPTNYKAGAHISIVKPSNFLEGYEINFKILKKMSFTDNSTGTYWITLNVLIENNKFNIKFPYKIGHISIGRYCF